jgi:hypothetical protein
MIKIVHDRSKALKNTNAHKNYLRPKGLISMYEFAFERRPWGVTL